MKSNVVKSLASLFLALALTLTTGVIAFAADNSRNVGEGGKSSVVAYIKSGDGASNGRLSAAVASEDNIHRTC